jgi:hypothetical protein
MSLRSLLVALVLLASAGFVVGTTIERNSGESRHESAATLHAEGSTGEAQSEEGESGGEHREATHAGETEHHAELKPLGVDIEAVPFVVLAVFGSLALALGAWLRPRWVALLIVTALAMLAFAALDVRELFHQQDEARNGLAILAGAIALLHGAAAVVAGLMVREAR